MKKNENSNQANSSLRICCYGSSRHETPERYLKEAYLLGQTLAERGHTCVNGAGAYGCMGSMNQGVLDFDGHVIGVAHKMFISNEDQNKHWLESFHPVFSIDRSSHHNKSEFIIVDGDDLQQRKRTLVKGADALIVMPGGPGTFDEVWEMVCSRQIGLMDIPIVCVNIDGFYDSFAQILDRAYREKFLYKSPSDLLHFLPSSAEAVDYIERYISNKKVNQDGSMVVVEKRSERIRRTLKRRPSILASFLNISLSSHDSDNWNGNGEDFDCDGNSSNHSASWNRKPNQGFHTSTMVMVPVATFALGVAIGMRFNSAHLK